MKTESGTKLMTTREVAEKLSVSRKQVIRWIYGASLPCFRVARDFRFIESEVDKWIEEHRHKNAYDAERLARTFMEAKKNKASSK